MRTHGRTDNRAACCSEVLQFNYEKKNQENTWTGWLTPGNEIVPVNLESHILMERALVNIYPVIGTIFWVTPQVWG